MIVFQNVSFWCPEKAGSLLSHGRIAADGDREAILKDRELLEANRLELPLCLQAPGRLHSFIAEETLTWNRELL